MKYLYVYFVICLLNVSVVSAQSLPLISKVNAFQDYTGSHPVEKIYLHLDKPYYAAGEYMYFRAYLADPNLSPENAKSGIIYVELSDAKKNLVKRVLLYSETKEFIGQMQLPDSLPSAAYHLRAYTNLMRNAGEDYFYRRDIHIGNPTASKQKITSQPFDYSVSFFPEGGRLLSGLSCKVAFKALGNDGFGTDITGVLSDSEGKELLKFNSAHLGMGSFSFTPEKGKTYKVSVQSNGIKKEYTLPGATEGLALSARQDNDSIYLAIRSANEERAPIYLIGQSRDSICFAVEGFTGSKEQLISVEKEKFPTGIAQFMLFKNGNPVSERLVFIDRKDDLHVIIVPDKEKYADREKATVRIRIYDKDSQPVEGSFSLSVTDNKLVTPSVEEQNIKGSLALAEDLKGYIESPGWYFSGDEPERAEALDNLLCTQGWTRFIWDKLPAPADVYPVESEFQITGKVTNLSGKSVQNVPVSLISNANMPGTALTDENGRFGFYGFNCPEGASFVLKCLTKNNQNSLGIKLDKSDNRQAQTNVLPLTERDNKSVDELMTSYTEQAGRQLKYRLINLPGVTVNAIDVKQKTSNERAVGVKSYHYGEQTLNKKISIVNVMQTLPKPTQGPYSLHAIPPPVWYIVDDGMKIDWNTFRATYNSYHANMFESVDILSPEDAVTLYGLDASRGAYVIKTKKIVDVNNDYNNNTADASALTYRPEGYCVRKEFYVPAYDNPEVKQDKTPDLRTTIYWNPTIRTNNEGRAEVSFFTADNTGAYSYILEGIGDNKFAFVKK
jgi:hypothetical protein